MTNSMRRKKLFLIAALAITTGATARDYITVTTNQHDSHAYAPGEVKAITFSGNTMQVNKQDGPTAIVSPTSTRSSSVLPRASMD